LVSGFLFSVFSALFGEKPLFQPFVFKMLSALDTLSDGGHEVAMQFGVFEAAKAAP
jgi:predicted Co/Zn/Cd cation transporter (cation efflux family)